MMLNIDTWYYYKSPLALNERDEGKQDFSTLDYCNRAREIVNLSLTSELDVFDQKRKLADSEKKEMTDLLIKEFLDDLKNDTTLNPKTLIEGKVFKKFKDMFHKILFPLDNNRTNVDFELLIEMLHKINMSSEIFYADSYSIFKIAELLNHQKNFYFDFENEYPAEATRKATYKTLTKIKETLLSSQEENRNNLNISEKLYAEFIGKFFTDNSEKKILDITHSSKTQSLKNILRLIPERIITSDEIIPHNKINFKRSSKKNKLLLNFLNCFYPEKKYFSSDAEYPSNYDTEYMKYVDATVRQFFY